MVVAAASWLVFGRQAPIKGIVGERGEIKVASQPSGATISLDGKQLSKRTDTTISAPVGRRTVTLNLSGYDSIDLVVEVKSSQTAELEHVFTKNGLSVVGTPGPDGATTTYAPDQLTTYTSKQFGFSIQYPKDWKVETDPEGFPHFYNRTNAAKAERDPGAELAEALFILVQDNPNRLAPQAWYQSRPEYSQEDQSQIKQQSLTVGGQAAYQYETPYGFTPYLVTVFTQGTKAYLLQQKLGSPDRAIYNQLISTFQLP